MKFDNPGPTYTALFRLMCLRECHSLSSLSGKRVYSSNNQGVHLHDLKAFQDHRRDPSTPDLGFANAEAPVFPPVTSYFTAPDHTTSSDSYGWAKERDFGERVPTWVRPAPRDAL